MNFEAMLVGERENLDQPHRVLLKEIVAGQRKPAAVEPSAFSKTRPGWRQNISQTDSPRPSAWGNPSIW